MAEPVLVFRRTGKTIGKVVAWGFGGGTVLLGVTSAAADAFRAAAILPALRAYTLAALPFFFFGLILALCRRELWFVPELRAFHMLTFRPWRRGPRIEQASVDEYAGLCRVAAEPSEESPRTVVALLTPKGAAIPVREMEDVEEAEAFLQKLAEVTELPLRAGPVAQSSDAASSETADSDAASSDTTGSATADSDAASSDTTGSETTDSGSDKSQGSDETAAQG